VKHSIREQYWTLSILGLVVVLTFWRGNQLPVFGPYEIKTILLGIIPIALLAMGQSIIIIGGGINLAIGAEAIFINCITAKYSEGSDFITSLKWAVLGIIIATVVGAVTGWIISKSGIADIVVTLATSFILIGLALFIQPGPGGGVNIDFAQYFSGSGNTFIAPLLVLILPILFIWLPLQRSRLGISFYAIGSNKDAAFLSGVNVAGTRIALYSVGGVFAGLCGVSLTAITQAASPFAVISNTATLNSVAAAVLGGVALSGGVGGLFGPALASLVLYYIPTIMLGYGIDPAYSQIIQGALTVLVVLIGGLLRAGNKR
jgi:ribose transport system permease protein